MTCLFCQIIARQVPAKIVYEDEQLLAFDDIHPQAPTHILIIPKKHIATVNDITIEDGPVLGAMIEQAKCLATKRGFQAAGYRLVMNVNTDGGQAVYHIHLHLLGGRTFAWPPG